MGLGALELDPVHVPTAPKPSVPKHDVSISHKHHQLIPPHFRLARELVFDVDFSARTASPLTFMETYLRGRNGKAQSSSLPCSQLPCSPPFRPSFPCLNRSPGESRILFSATVCAL